MKKASIFLISYVVLASVLCAEPQKSETQKTTEAQKIVRDFYAGEPVSAEDVLLLVQDTSIENPHEYLLSHTALSTVIPVVEGERNLFVQKIREFEKSFKPFISKSKDAELVHLYSNYLYSKFSWEEHTLGLIEELPIQYQKNAFFSKDRRALLDMAVWYTSSAKSSTALWNAFVIQQEKLIEELALTDVEKFNACINYSLFYMKNLNTKKGFEYLEKARAIFPNGIMVAMIESNYADGRIGW